MTSVLPKIEGGVLDVDRAPYHMVLTNDTRPANSKVRTEMLVDSWLPTMLFSRSGREKSGGRHARARI